MVTEWILKKGLSNEPFIMQITLHQGRAASALIDDGCSEKPPTGLA